MFRTLTSFGFGPSFLKWIYAFYNNISSCVINDGFSTQPFPVERGVREGDPLFAYLFIIVLEILCISIRNSKDICGIKVDNEEIRLSLFADDLTGFLKDNLSLANFLKVPLRRNFTFLFSLFLPRITYRHVRCPFVQKKKLKRFPSLKFRRSKSEILRPPLLESGSS